MPHYDLNQVLAAVAAGKVRAAFGSALRKYQEAMGYIMADREKLRKEIMEGLSKLRPQNFSETRWIKDDESKETVPYDVYGLPDFKGWDWYVKFSIQDDDWVFNLSFHLPHHPVKSAATRQVICEDALTQQRNKEPY
jgi:hypothetical protein